MILHEISLKKSLNKAYRLIKPKRPDIELFKSNLIKLLGQIDEKESEENVKIHLMDFLKDTWYKQEYLVATKGHTDFVIHTGKEAKAPSGVLFEVKRPTNKGDMVTRQNLNAKAMHELILYYLRERVNENNIDIRHLVITNIYEWFIFDASIFERVVVKNSKLIKAFKDWGSGQKVSSNTDLFYKEIAKPFLDELKEDISYTWFDIREYEKPLKNNDKADDNKLIALFKVFSPIHLLKIQFANDSNSLDKGFYSELLHIIGLEEVKDGGKKLIRRKQAGKRDAGSLLENAITILDLEDSLNKVPDINSYGEKREERLFNLSLELCITWINRVLFLKLLEAQLIKYHKGDQSYKFLNHTKISQYDELYKLFFQVLAKKQGDRTEAITKKFGNIPYLNSSLFEISELEDQTIKINSLDDSLELDLHSGTVLRDAKNKPIAKSLNGLQYLFDFLEAYDFASEGSEEIQEDSKTLINASVLGLIFEKINGYKDGSIFTPGFITMYMCRQAIRLAVLQKFKDAYGWKCEAFGDLRNYMADRRSSKDVLEFNALINGMHLCDPAVGSGHFLVSSLNEIISIKAELGILADDKGGRLSGYDIEIENDELIVTCNEGQDIFEYHVNNGIINKETQRVQKSLFHEKQTIIENCLFGVDINANSVKICRLRLWIELLKNAYYTEETKFKELETLPNIDINIKCGNSLISRFALDADLSKALKSIKYNINQYKGFVHDYKNAHDKELKRGLEQIINSIKNDFRIEISKSGKEFKDLSKWKGELINLTKQTGLFEKTPKEKKEFDGEVKKLAAKITKQEALIEDIKSNAIYRNAFEWRFEFPEVLDNDGNFEGFDVVLGNPPYISNKEMHKLKMQKSIEYMDRNYVAAKSGNYDLYIPFIEKGLSLLKSNAELTFILPNKFIIAKYSESLLKYINQKYTFLNYTDFSNINVFEEASVYPIILRMLNTTKENANSITQKLSVTVAEQIEVIKSEDWDYLNHSLTNNEDSIDGKLLSKIESMPKIENKLSFSPGINGFQFTNYGQCIKEGKKETNSKRIVVTGVIDRYCILNKPVRYKGVDYKSPYIYFDPKIISEGKWELFSTPKIVVAGMTKYIEATLDETGDLAPGVSVYSIMGDIQTLKFTLAIINSKLIDFYFKIRFQDKHLAGGYISMNTVLLQKIPIPQIDDKNPIIDIVDTILTEKKSNPNSDTTKWEKEIDKKIYKLFNLTEEEVKTVEGK
ncbi:MAG: Eco57I restriction-modification methylase domain-containing protein [Chitinophagaceae bacterium]|nr:Eco57I restriction-modification methylase domain-containing protein [Chitinophagaceae bacterium]